MHVIYTAAGRRVRASTRQTARSGHKAQPNALNTTEVREWAKAQGIDVKERGRIPAELVVKFKAATGN
jgi:Lsr2